jgi:hypothetical protein
MEKNDNLKKGKGFDVNPQNINRNGPPRKLFTIIKDCGYSKDDAREAMHQLAWLPIDELEKIFKDKNSPVIIKVIAHAFQKAILKGDYRYISEIIQQSIGKPTENVNANNSGEILIKVVYGNREGNTIEHTSSKSNEDTQ